MVLTRRNLIAALPYAGAFAAPDTWKIDADVPGGNIIVDRLDGDRAMLRPDLRDTEGDWFYWAFRVRGAGGRTVTFQFDDRPRLTALGPAVSLDGGKTWRWVGADSGSGSSFRYAFAAEHNDVRFSMTIPYFAANLAQFVEANRRPFLTVETLTTSRKGRPIEMLRVGRSNAKYRAILTARHHACESLASYCQEGLVAEVLSDSEDGQWLRNNVEFIVIPFMDKDGVEDGDQGKNRRPHDHNRDYNTESIYPSVRALRKVVPEWSTGKPAFALDMHCPYISGKGHEEIHFVGGRDQKVWQEVLRFSILLEKAQTGPLIFRSVNNMPFGTGWNSESNFKGGSRSFAMWAAELTGVVFSATLELPYARAGGNTVDPASARAFGRDLALTLRRYFARIA